MPPEPPADIAWHASVIAAATALETHARSLLGPGTVTSGRLCAACGSDAHGRPWTRHDDRPVHVSLSRSGPHLVTAIAPLGSAVPIGSAMPIGVDVEVERIDVHPSLVLASDETGDLARAWARKEAILKARGTGLMTPMSSVVLVDERWWDLPAPEGYVAALAVAPRLGNERVLKEADDDPTVPRRSLGGSPGERSGRRNAQAEPNGSPPPPE